MPYTVKDGRVAQALWLPSPNFDERDVSSAIEAVIIHCISLPPGEYGGGEIQAFFQNALNASAHNYFRNIAHLTVSAHFLVDRLGQVTQFVSTEQRAWHAGESLCFERPKVNDFSIGIELEGWDEDPDGFTQAQYKSLSELCVGLMAAYPKLNQRRLFAHSDIAPGRKPDPGPYSDWTLFNRKLSSQL